MATLGTPQFPNIVSSWQHNKIAAHYIAHLQDQEAIFESLVDTHGTHLPDRILQRLVDTSNEATKDGT